MPSIWFKVAFMIETPTCIFKSCLKQIAKIENRYYAIFHNVEKGDFYRAMWQWVLEMALGAFETSSTLDNVASSLHNTSKKQFSCVFSFLCKSSIFLTLQACKFFCLFSQT